jgi:Bacterial antitoxin of type II TA system, VapB
MRTNVDIDDDLLTEAMAVSGLSPKKATVEEVLRRLVQRYYRRAARSPGSPQVNHRPTVALLSASVSLISCSRLFGLIVQGDARLTARWRISGH